MCAAWFQNLYTHHQHNNTIPTLIDWFPTNVLIYKSKVHHLLLLPPPAKYKTQHCIQLKFAGFNYANKVWEYSLTLPVEH